MKIYNIEKIIPFGYLILVVLGIVKECVYYGFIGINILKYSNLMDILISPISDMTSHPIILLCLLAYVSCIYFYFSYATKNTHKNWVKKLVNSKPEDELTRSEFDLKLSDKFLSVILFTIMSFFLGIGLGNGHLVSQKIADNKLKFNHSLTFNSGETRRVSLVGSNSANFFYVEKGNNNVKISPVGAIKTIELLK
ncbi:MAG: hypothetical protein QM535_06030 [Limnohabitans sp.]|nr:hypothetical protein [Limnohabitans sp.]